MVVVSFYTAGTPYEQEAAELRKTLERFGLACDIRCLPHPGSWAKAGLLFPGFIRDVRRDHPAQSALFLDADARVMKDITTSEFDGMPGNVAQARPLDAAFYWLPNSPRSPDGTGRELCTGTMWFAPTPAASKILDLWAVACAMPGAEKIRGGDQEILQTQVLPRVPEARLYELPPEWCWMADISVQHYGDRQPVILQTQASRRHKNKVNFTVPA